MTKSERILLFLRLLKTHRDGLTAQELQHELDIRPSAFYNYVGILRRMSFNIKCRMDGRYILILDKKAEKMIVDRFPGLLVHPRHEKFMLREGLEVIYSQIYAVTEKETNSTTFFREVASVCVQYPELQRYLIYDKGRDGSRTFETPKYLIRKGSLLGYKDTKVAG